MNRRLYQIAFVLFLVCLAYDLVVWGAVRGLPEIGPAIADSAGREAPLASTYIFLGQPLDHAIAPLRAVGEAELSSAFAEGWSQLREQPIAAMDLIFDNTWNDTHRRIRLLYWATPLLLVLALLLWWRRARPIRLMDRR